jgi:hypothetical protein
MSIELKMTGYGSGRKSRLYKKKKRASINRIDATHLPMRYLETVFEDGKLVKEYSLSEIRRNIDGTIQSSL